MKGILKLHLPKVWLAPSCVLSEVLHSLAQPLYEPLHKASLPDLMKKALFLIATTLACGRGCLQAIILSHCRYENHGVHLIWDTSFVPNNQLCMLISGDVFIPGLKTVSAVV